MSKWDGKSKGTTVGYAIFIFIIRYTGLVLAYFVLYFVSLYYCFFSVKSSKIIFSFYRKRLKFSVIKSILSVYFNYYNFGQTLIDRIASLTGKFTFNIEFEGEQYLHEIANQGKGGFMFSAHIGNWEIAGHYLTRIPTTFAIVMYENERENIKKQIEKVGVNQAVRFIFIKEDLSHIYEMADALDQNQIICMHADRYLEGVKTELADLYNEPAPFPVGPWVFASKFKVPVTFVFGMKESYKNYHFYASAPQVYEWQRGDEGFKQGIQKALKEYTFQIESKIQKYPYQWFNYYDFWKKN